jgi:hypothetical protein
VSSTDEGAFAAGAAEAARLAREVQDLGFVTARTIVERFVEMCAQFTTSSGASGAGGVDAVDGADRNADQARRAGGAAPPFWFWGSDASLRKMQSDMLRATEDYMAVLNQLNDASLRFFDATRWWAPAGAERGDLLLPEVAAGGRASARLWIHNTTASPAVDLRPWCAGLASHSGEPIAATAVTCQPERIDRLDPDASRELVVTVAVGEEAAAGLYHGQLLVDGLPDVMFPLRLRVRPEAAR